VPGLEVRVQLLEPLVHLQGGPTCPLRVVLTDLGDAEGSHDRVADVLLDRSAPRRHDAGHRREVGREQRAKTLRVEALAELGRADDVGEQDRDELALLRVRDRLHR
jgi:hypothetical protein